MTSSGKGKIWLPSECNNKYRLVHQIKLLLNSCTFRESLTEAELEEMEEMVDRHLDIENEYELIKRFGVYKLQLGEY